MSYFKNFPTVGYNFGDETDTTVIQNITVMSEIIDQIKDNITIYRDYYIPEGERPDQTSMKLYETPHLHWTFFLMNDNLREVGWPLSNKLLLDKAKKEYPNTVLTTRSVLYDKFKVGQTIIGNVSGVTATINHRHLDLGQVVITGATGTFTNGELITSINADGNTESITLVSSSPEYLSAAYYVNGDLERVDFDPTVGPGVFLTEVTYQDRYIEANDNLRQIRIIKPSLMPEIVRSHRQSLVI